MVLRFNTGKITNFFKPAKFLTNKKAAQPKSDGKTMKSKKSYVKHNIQANELRT